MRLSREFDIETVTDSEFKAVLTDALEKKAKNVTICGASLGSTNLRVWDIKISDEDFAKFKKSNRAFKMVKERYDKEKKEKIRVYKALRAKCDFCLHDVKAYIKLLENIEEFSYCSATSELQTLETRYLKGKGYTKAVYRSRLAEYSKVEC